jgi:hypothetical protein
MLDTRTAIHFIHDHEGAVGPTVHHPSFFEGEGRWQTQWFLHMDAGWMWRWFLTNDRGKPLAMSKKCFFHREDAVRNLEAARMAVIGL